MAKRKPNPAFMKALTPSDSLAEIVGAKALPRTQAVKKIWAYIKSKGLQDKKNRRMINPDKKLKEVIGPKSINMFQMTSKIMKNLA